MQNTGTLKVATSGDREIVIAVPAQHVTEACQPRKARRLGRSIGAVFAGLLAIALLDNAIDFVLHGTGVYPPMGVAMAEPLFLIAIAYRFVDGILGCAIAARLAPRRPMRHALILGAVGVVLSSLGVLATLSGGPELGPIWYPVALVIMTPFVAWIGGTLGERRHRSAQRA